MALKNNNQRVGVFVDVQNMYHSAKKIHGGNVNFKNILKDAADNRIMMRARAYVVKSETVEEGNFFEALASQGYDVRVQDLKIFAGGAKKGDWDVGLTVDVIRFATRLDVVVLITGDGDFVPLVEYLQNQGVQVEVMAFAESTSQSLIEAADDFKDLSRDVKKYVFKK